MKKILLVLALLIGTQNANAAKGFSLVGALDYNLDKITVLGAEVKGGLGFGGGLMAHLGVIDAGALYLSRTTSTTILGVSVSTSTSSVYVPVSYRLGAGPIGFGLGGFFDLSLESGGGTNYGVLAGPRLNSGPIFFDLTFNYGLKSGNSKDILLLVGYHFGGK